jgi:chromate transporter
MIASTFYIMKDISITEFKTVSFINIGVMFGTFALLKFTKIPPPFIVLACLLLGFVV